MGLIRTVAIALAAVVLLTACVPSVSPRQPTTVTVVAIMMPMGGAPPEVLALYQAALELNRAPERELDVRIITAAPQMPQPGVPVRFEPG